MNLRLKFNGAKYITEAMDSVYRVVGERSVRIEAQLESCVDFTEVRMQV